jgi:HAD superfamily hydrolase (TIGR01509 family)
VVHSDQEFQKNKQGSTLFQFDLVIFDCDGVLVDSERLANQVFATILLEEYGLRLSLKEMFRHFVGRSRSQCMSVIEEMVGSQPSARVADRYETEINAALELSVEAVTGVHSVLANLELPFCVASSGSHQKMKKTLGKTDLMQYVEGKVFSTSDVSRGKPFPDIYLYAASQMGVNDPARCLVIEDSPAGVKAAVRAGMSVFGYAELMDAGSLSSAGAHQIFDDMSELPVIIEETEKQRPGKI